LEGKREKRWIQSGDRRRWAEEVNSEEDRRRRDEAGSKEMGSEGRRNNDVDEGWRKIC
jgi:hypothetical protein